MCLGVCKMSNGSHQEILSTMFKEKNPAKLGIVIPLFIMIIAFIYQSFTLFFRAEEIAPLLTAILFFSIGVYYNLRTETHNSTNQEGEIISTKNQETIGWIDNPPIFVWIAYLFSVAAFFTQLIIWARIYWP